MASKRDGVEKHETSLERVNCKFWMIWPEMYNQKSSKELEDHSSFQRWRNRLRESPWLQQRAGPWPSESWFVALKCFHFCLFFCLLKHISLCINNTNVSGGNVKYLHLEEWAVFQVVVVVVWCANERKMVRTETWSKKICWAVTCGEKAKGSLRLALCFQAQISKLHLTDRQKYGSQNGSFT